MVGVRSRIVIPVALVMAVMLMPAVSGCSGVEGIVKSATGGKVDIGGDKVPTDFPRAVPLIKGSVTLGAGIGSGSKKVWNVTIKVPNEAAFNTIDSELTSAGFTGDFTTAGDSGATGHFTSPEYGVLVVVAGDDKSGWLANYTVTHANAAK